jgi:hypothetical protein
VANSAKELKFATRVTTLLTSGLTPYFVFFGTEALPAAGGLGTMQQSMMIQKDPTLNRQ